MRQLAATFAALALSALPALAAPCYLSQSGPIQPSCDIVVYNGSAAATLTLPDVAWKGTVVDQGPGALTLAGANGAPVNGGSSVALAVGSGGTLSGGPSEGWTFAGQTSGGTVITQAGSSVSYSASNNPTGTSQLLTNSSGTTAVTLPAASVFGPHFWAQFYAENAPASFTPASGSINGASSLTIGQGQWAFVQSDGTNYEAAVSGNTCDPGFSYDPQSGQCFWTQTANNSASLAWTGLVRDKYSIQCSNLVPAASEILYLQFGTGAGPTWETSSYEWFSVYAGASQNPVKSDSTSDIGVAFPGTVDEGSLGINGSATVQGLRQAGGAYSAAEGLFLVGGGVLYRQDTAGFWNNDSTGAMSSLRIIAASSTNLSSGSCTLWPLATGVGQ
jgi:hypothetical protein